MRPLFLDSMMMPMFITTGFLCMFIVFAYILYHGLAFAIVLSELILEVATRAIAWLWDIINEYNW